jgi:hypothetical protein
MTMSELKRTVPCADPRVFRSGLLVMVAFLACFSGRAAETVSLFAQAQQPMLEFALGDLRSALAKRGADVQTAARDSADIVLLDAAAYRSLSGSNHGAPKVDFDFKPEGFSLQKTDGGRIWVIGADDAGLMYGTLELAEQIRLHGRAAVRATSQNPHLAERGVKFNLPLDLRTPTYTDPGEASQENMAEMWSMEFWTGFIDHLARHRYNMISLWNLHPFPSMVKVPEYPDIALNDVVRTKVPINRFYEIGNGAKYPELFKETEVIKRITIEEKMAFWRAVMRYGRERNVKFYLMTWNIFDWGFEGKPGMDIRAENPVTRDYYRQSVKQFLLAYPDLAGIGLTVGENMVGYDLDVKEQWAFDTYGRGVLEALAQQPGRKLTFLHRMHQGNVQTVERHFAPLITNRNVQFLFSFKYAEAHVMSSTVQPFANKFVQEIKGKKTIWTLRNDDNFYFRWGAPGFVREFVRNLPPEVSEGFYYGSDGYIWGREFLAKEPAAPRPLEIEKHWYHWMSFGRLGYNPGLSDEWFAQMLRDRFPEVDGKALFEAWQEASLIYPLTTGFHWGAADFSWYIEGCRSHPVGARDKIGYHGVEQFIVQPVHAGTRNQPIPDYVKTVVAGRASPLKSPLQVAAELHAHADRAQQRLATLPAARDPELANTLADIRCISLLGRYYAHKIAAATHLALFRANQDPATQAQAVAELEKALATWKDYSAQARQRYKNPVRFKRVGDVDWEKAIADLEGDIAIAREGRPAPAAKEAPKKAK